MGVPVLVSMAGGGRATPRVAAAAKAANMRTRAQHEKVRMAVLAALGGYAFKSDDVGQRGRWLDWSGQGAQQVSGVDAVWVDPD